LVLPILGAAAVSGTPWLGGVLLFVFGLTRGIPLLVVGAATGRIKAVPRLTMWVPKIERASGILLLLAAVYFLYQSAIFAGLIVGMGPMS
jgi:cytochrome c-type biogenesis protein